MDKRQLLAGSAIFTVAVPATAIERHGCKPHYTYRVKRKEADAKSAEIWFVNLLAGPNNLDDYQPLGYFRQDGKVRLVRTTRYGEDSYPVKLIRRVVELIVTGDDLRGMREAGFDLLPSGRCCRCARLLTDPESIEAGIGPECRNKL